MKGEKCLNGIASFFLLINKNEHVFYFPESSNIWWASRVAQMVKNPPTMQETWVQSLGWEDALEEEMATQSSILAWKIPWTEEPVGCSP